jgi:hypothetical protein
MKRPEGVSLISLYFFAMSIPSLIGACMILTGTIFTGVGARDYQLGVVAGLTALILLLILAFGLGILFFVTALGLWGMRNWARWLAVIISILSLFAFPIGTVIGAVTIWYLFKEDIRESFEFAGKPEESLVEEALDEFEELFEEPESSELAEPEETAESDQTQDPDAPLDA